MESRPTYISKKEALNKAEHYCAYQERSQYEVRGKLIEWGCYGDDLEDVLVTLIQSNFLNEERFAKAYAGGKFRMKQWGKAKIKQGLKLKQVSEYCIKRGLAEINADDYYATLEAILAKKAKEVKEPNAFKRNYKLAAYAMSRGYEADLIWEILGRERE